MEAGGRTGTQRTMKGVKVISSSVVTYVSQLETPLTFIMLSHSVTLKLNSKTKFKRDTWFH